MRREKTNPLEMRESLQDYEYRLKQLAKTSLLELKKNEFKPIKYLLK